MSGKVTVRTDSHTDFITGSKHYETKITDGKDTVKAEAYTREESRQRAEDKWTGKKLSK